MSGYRRVAFSVLIIAGLFLVFYHALAQGVDYDLSLEHGGLRRTYKVHIPPSYKKAPPAPLVLAFHGGGGNSELMANDEYYNLVSKSDEEGFIIVFPCGASKLRSGKFATWNAGNCCGYARDHDVDDVGFVREMLKDIESKFAVDPSRIYALGFSNGGMFTYRLACELTDKFRAVASVAGTDNCRHCSPGKPVSIMHIHAKNDSHLLFDGGAGPDAFRDLSKVTDFTSVPETISRWRDRNHCGGIPERVLEKEGVYCDRYADCSGGVQVMFCVTESGGHSWPGGQKPRRRKASSPSNTLSATDEIWEFFKAQ